MSDRTVAMLASCLMTVPALGTEPMIVAHRGASHDAPENTLAAFREAWEQGADAIEGDFHLTADGEIVCIHDDTTQRTAGVNRRVDRSTLAELRELDVGTWKADKFAGEKIPTLAEVLATVPDGKRILIEVKCGPEIAAPLGAVIRESGLKAGQIAVIAFEADVIAESKKQLPDIKAFWLTGYREDGDGGGFSPTIDRVLATLKRANADGLDSNAHPSVDEGFVRKLRDIGMEFHVWTVDDPEVARRFRDLGVDSITTNRPAWLRGQLKND